MIEKGDLTVEREYRAAVAPAKTWAVDTALAGTITWAEPAGTIIDFGEPILFVDERPLSLAMGRVPMFRELVNPATLDAQRLAEAKKNTAASPDAGGGDVQGAADTSTTAAITLPESERAGPVQGSDVRQLQEFLVSQGFDLAGKLRIDGDFGGQTEAAVKAWQQSVGLPQTGRVDSATLIFAPSPVVMIDDLQVGTRFESLTVGLADGTVVSDLPQDRSGDLAVGTEVRLRVEGDDRWVSNGVVVTQVAIENQTGQPVMRSTIELEGDLPPGASNLVVEVSEVLVADAIKVPGSALISLNEGGFAVEVIEASDTRLVGVRVLSSSEGTVAISGDVSAGQRVVVPQ